MRGQRLGWPAWDRTLKWKSVQCRRLGTRLCSATTSRNQGLEAIDLGPKGRENFLTATLQLLFWHIAAVAVPSTPCRMDSFGPERLFVGFPRIPRSPFAATSHRPVQPPRRSSPV